MRDHLHHLAKQLDSEWQATVAEAIRKVEEGIDPPWMLESLERVLVTLVGG